MKHDKLVFIRIICLVGIIGEVLFPNSTGGILFGLILAITSVIFLLMLKNEMALEKSDCENNYSISIMCISVVVLLLIIVGYIILTARHGYAVVADAQVGLPTVTPVTTAEEILNTHHRWIHNTERFSNYYAVGYARIFLF